MKDQINTTFEDPECRELFMEAFLKLVESDRRLGQLRPIAQKHIAGDPATEQAA